MKNVQNPVRRRKYRATGITRYTSKDPEGMTNETIPGHIRGEWYENNGNEEGDVNPEQMGINGSDEIEMAVMIRPEACKN